MPSGRLIESRNVNHYVLSLNMGLMKILAAHANRQIRGRYWNLVVQLLILIATLLFSGTVKRICLMNKDNT